MTFLIICLFLTTLSLNNSFTVAANKEFTFDLEEFKNKIQSSDEVCWKKPAQNRKNTICNKISVLQELIEEGNLEDAYDKLLYDIKPKLTGLKTDENEQPWGNGIFKRSWVKCSNLQEEFQTDCNLILHEINPETIVDDDTAPFIGIYYIGGNDNIDPGYWIVKIEDYQSGIGEVQISVDGNLEVSENLNGLDLILYEIFVPSTVGFHTIYVLATNHDFTPDIDTKSMTVEIRESPLPEPL
ncbi:MAG: exported protein of unknown function [Promethearchaeota archaeon]|nr:MAG: exported protein of unknown function [Candidatus Lokiarchaeota archaeon]